MYAYELLPKLTHLTLVGFEDGRYEFMGTDRQRDQAIHMENVLSGAVSENPYDEIARENGEAALRNF